MQKNMERLSVVMFIEWLMCNTYLADVRRRIELIQEFEMPTASTNIQVSADRRYIMTTGKENVAC